MSRRLQARAGPAAAARRGLALAAMFDEKKTTMEAR
jgi:hypothetical protein